MFKSNVQQVTHHQVGKQTLEIVRTARKNSIALKVRADKVVILVPKDYSNRRLQNVFKGNQSWLLHSLTKLEQRLQHQTKRSIFNGVDGERFDFLGRTVTLVLRDSHLERGGRNFDSPDFSSVRIQGQQCIVSLNAVVRCLNEQERSVWVCQAIEAFMKQQAQSYLSDTLLSYAQQVGVTYQGVAVKGYKSRWGSCYADGRLQFNWRLWQAPPWVIDYVVVHELCHLIHPNHSKAFWALVMQHYPKTQAAKLYIKQHGTAWIHFLQT